MKKQGFTLIELMVVIVIMGILAAVAVPKLFGMIAKSKASEVGPAAGTYVKLQDAYVAETGAYLGNWDKIGYSVPGNKSAGTAGQTGTTGTTTNFIYTEGNAGLTFADGTASLGTSAPTTHLWSAKNILKLNDCIGDQENWGLAAYLTSATASGGQYKWITHEGSNCDALTPNFKNLGSGTY